MFFRDESTNIKFIIIFPFVNYDAVLSLLKFFYNIDDFFYFDSFTIIYNDNGLPPPSMIIQISSLWLKNRVEQNRATVNGTKCFHIQTYPNQFKIFQISIHVSYTLSGKNFLEVMDTFQVSF